MSLGFGPNLDASSASKFPYQCNPSLLHKQWPGSHPHSPHGIACTCPGDKYSLCMPWQWAWWNSEAGYRIPRGWSGDDTVVTFVLRPCHSIHSILDCTAKTSLRKLWRTDKNCYHSNTEYLQNITVSSLELLTEALSSAQVKWEQRLDSRHWFLQMDSDKTVVSPIAFPWKVSKIQHMLSWKGWVDFDMKDQLCSCKIMQNDVKCFKKCVGNV